MQPKAAYDNLGPETKSTVCHTVQRLVLVARLL